MLWKWTRVFILIRLFTPSKVGRGMGIHPRWTEGFIPLQTNVIFNWNFITLQQITLHWFVVQINPICGFYACSSDSFWSLEKSSQTSDFFVFLVSQLSLTLWTWNFQRETPLDYRTWVVKSFFIFSDIRKTRFLVC